MTTSNTPESLPAGFRALAFAAVLAGGLARLAELGARDKWVDEHFTWRAATLPWDLGWPLIASEPHPLGYFLSMRAWTGLFGGGELALRLPSAFAAILSLALVWVVARRLVGERAAAIAVWLAALSPFLLLFDRIARYYAVASLFGLLASYALLRLRDGRRFPVLYAAAVAGGMWVFYPFSGVVVAHAAWLALSRAARPVWARWLAACGGAAALCLPVAGHALGRLASQAQGGAFETDLARSPLGAVLKLTQPALVFATGETIFPWNPLGAALWLALAAAVIVGLARLPWRTATFLACTLAIPVLWNAALMTAIVPWINFYSSPSRSLFAWPAFAIAAASGLARLPRRGQVAAGAAIVVGFALADANYALGRDFLNPSFIVPARAVLADIEAQARPGDVILADEDTLVWHYDDLQPPGTGIPAFNTWNEAAARPVWDRRPPRVWLVILGRDGTRGIAPTSIFRDVEASYRLVAERGYVEQDATYTWVKEQILRNPSYRFKVTVRLYERP